jgi:hypothetical protein
MNYGHSQKSRDLGQKNQIIQKSCYYPNVLWHERKKYVFRIIYRGVVFL